MTSEELKAALKEKKINKKAFAKKCGITYGYLCSLTNGYADLKGETEQRIVTELIKQTAPGRQS